MKVKYKSVSFNIEEEGQILTKCVFPLSKVIERLIVTGESYKESTQEFDVTLTKKTNNYEHCRNFEEVSERDEAL